MVLIHPFTQICSPVAPVFQAIFWRHNEDHHTIPVLREDVVCILFVFICYALQLLSMPSVYLGVSPLGGTTQKVRNECGYLIQAVPV